MDWLDRVKGRLTLESEDNLLDPHYENETELILSRKTYLKWTGAFFSLIQMFRASCILAVCDLTRKGVDFNTVDIKKEGQGLLLRSAQTHFSKDINKMSDSLLQGVKTMSLRLQSHTAREIYGTRFLPLLGSDDPLRLKL